MSKIKILKLKGCNSSHSWNVHLDVGKIVEEKDLTPQERELIEESEPAYPKPKAQTKKPAQADDSTESKGD